MTDEREVGNRVSFSLESLKKCDVSDGLSEMSARYYVDVSESFSLSVKEKFYALKQAEKILREEFGVNAELGSVHMGKIRNYFFAEYVSYYSESDVASLPDFPYEFSLAR